jgi:HEPN domain-containing protein
MIDEYITNWLNKANKDLKSAEHELSLPTAETVTETVCFHCQQAVEKYLKAFLIFHKVEIKKTHIVEQLLLQCAKIDKDFENIEVVELSRFAVDIRYPDDFYEPSIEEAKFYYNLAKQIRDSVITKLGIKEC